MAIAKLGLLSIITLISSLIFIDYAFGQEAIFCSGFEYCPDTAALHAGRNDPISEEWNLTGYPDNSAFSDTEETSTGIYDFWQIRDVSTATRSYWNYLHRVGESIINSGWVAEAIVRVVDAPISEGWNFGTQNLLVWDGCMTWGIRLANNSIGVHISTGTISPFTEELDTQTDYRTYRIEFRPNGPGLEDDTIDVYVDGERLFSEIRRDNFPFCDDSSEYPFLWFGSGNSTPIGTANWHKVKFSKRLPGYFHLP